MRGRAVNEDQLENPVLGYLVIAVALVVGMLSATVLGQGLEKSPAASAKTSSVASTIETQRGNPPVADQPSAAKLHTPVNQRASWPQPDPRRRDDATR